MINNFNPVAARINMLNLSLQRKYFDAIKAGTKTVEGRLNNSKFKDLKPGMQMSFTAADTKELIICTVKELNIYPSFKDMLEGEGVENMLPGVKDLEEGIKIYEGFPGYKEEVNKNGALAIRIKVYSNS